MNMFHILISFIGKKPKVDALPVVLENKMLYERLVSKKLEEGRTLPRNKVSAIGDSV